MIPGDARNTDWLDNTEEHDSAAVVFEGISMYLTTDEMLRFMRALGEHFRSVRILMDCYTERGAAAAKFKNPINDVGVTSVCGIDDPRILEKDTKFTFIKEHEMTPPEMMNELKGTEKAVFKMLFGGRFAKSIYRMYEYKK